MATSNLKPVASRTAFITRRGATVSDNQTGTSITVVRGAFGFSKDQVIAASDDATTVTTVASNPTVDTTLVLSQPRTFTKGDRILNLGADKLTGGTPDFDGYEGSEFIFSDPAGVVAHIKNQVSTDADGEGEFYIDAGRVFDHTIFDANGTISADSQTIADVAVAGNAVMSDVPDGAAAVAHIADTVNDLTTAGAKLYSWRNKGIEKASVDKDGDIVTSGSLSVTGASTLTGVVTATGLVKAVGGITADGTTLVAVLDIDESFTLGTVTQFAPDDATPAVGSQTVFRTANVSATTITNFDGARDGQQIVVFVGDAFTTFDFSVTGLLGNEGQNYVAKDTDAIFAIYNAALAKWQCWISRSGDFEGVILTLVSDVLTVNNLTKYAVVDAETGTADDLVTISGGRTGQWLTIAPFSGDTISVKETGNIIFAGGTSLALATTDKALFQFDGTNWEMFVNLGGALS